MTRKALLAATGVLVLGAVSIALLANGCTGAGALALSVALTGLGCLLLRAWKL